MSDAQTVARQIELMHAYHLDLWVEIEAQLRTMRASQLEIETLRNARTATDTVAMARNAALLLAHHVDTMKGRVNSLAATVTELEKTVAALRQALGEDK